MVLDRTERLLEATCAEGLVALLQRTDNVVIDGGQLVSDLPDPLDLLFIQVVTAVL